MLFVSPHLTYDPTESLEPAAEALTGMRADIPAEVNVATLAAGQWWVYPLARSSGDIFYGLRLTPGVALQQSAVVVAQRSVATTLASRPAYLVPTRIHRTILASPARWDEIAATPVARWKDLVALHHSLGGQDDLDELRKVLDDKRLQAQHALPGLRKVHPVRLETQARLDPTPETVAYTRYVARVVAERTAPLPALDAGCWNEALATLVLSMAEESSDDDERRAAEEWAARRIVMQLPGLDARSSIVTELSENESVRIAQRAAKIVLKAKEHADVDPRALPAIAKVTTATYDGATHLELATHLEAAKEYAGAFTSLMTAAFWQAQREDEVDATILERARTLARKASWTEIADSLDEMQEARADLINEGEWR